MANSCHHPPMPAVSTRAFFGKGALHLSNTGAEHLMVMCSRLELDMAPLRLCRRFQLVARARRFARFPHLSVSLIGLLLGGAMCFGMPRSHSGILQQVYMNVSQHARSFCTFWRPDTAQESQPKHESLEHHVVVRLLNQELSVWCWRWTALQSQSVPADRRSHRGMHCPCLGCQLAISHPMWHPLTLGVACESRFLRGGDASNHLHLLF